MTSVFLVSCSLTDLFFHLLSPLLWVLVPVAWVGSILSRPLVMAMFLVFSIALTPLLTAEYI